MGLCIATILRLLECSLSPITSVPPPHCIFISTVCCCVFFKKKRAHSKLRPQENRNNNAQQWCAIFCDCSHLFCSVLYCGIFFNKENSGLLTSNNCSVLLNLVNTGIKNSACVERKGNCCCFHSSVSSFFTTTVVSKVFFLYSS